MKEFIEIPDDKGNVHHFRYRDLNSFRDGYFHYEPQGGFHTPLSAIEIKSCFKPASSDDPEKFIDNLANLLSEDERVEGEYLERGMAIVNDWRKRQSPTSPDALVEAVKKIKSMKSGTYIHSGHEVLCNVCARLKKIASSALADHEKAGGK